MDDTIDIYDVMKFLDVEFEKSAMMERMKQYFHETMILNRDGIDVGDIIYDYEYGYCIVTTGSSMGYVNVISLVNHEVCICNLIDCRLIAKA